MANYALHFCLVIPLILFCFCRACCLTRYRKFKHYMFSNGTLRIFMTVYLDTVLFALLNIHEMNDMQDEKFRAMTVSNWLSVSFLALSVLVPVLVILIYCGNRHIMED